MGTPKAFVAKLERRRDAMKIDHFNANFWFGVLEQDKILRSMRLFAEEVTPAFALSPERNAA
jgi:hypothetical protein